MELSALRIFLAVAEEGGVSRAAERLHCVQSNVTARLRNLEEELGAELFYRKSRGMSLTPAGRNLLELAKKMLRLAEEARQVVQVAGEPRGALAIGAMETTAAIRLPPLLACYHRQYPEVEITLKTGPSEELLKLVLDYRLEGAFVGGAVEHPDIVQEEIFAEELVLVTGAGARGVEEAPPGALLVFRRGCSYRARLEDWLRAQGYPALKIMEFGTLEAILGCVAAGMGVTMLPRAVVTSERYGSAIAIHPVPGPLGRVPTMFIRRQDANLSPALAEFLRIVKEGKNLGPP